MNSKIDVYTFINFIIIHWDVNKHIETLLTTRFPVSLNNVEVKDSIIHGKGVFAVKDIKRGDIITLYPGDYLVYCPNNDRHIEGHLERYTISKDTNDEDFAKRVSSLISYKFNMDSRYSIIGDPNLIDDPAYLGHIVNDGAKVTDTLDNESIKLYIRDTIKLMNSYFEKIQNFMVAIIACRDIKKGEEILVSYGPEYWISEYKRKKLE